MSKPESLACPVRFCVLCFMKRKQGAGALGLAWGLVGDCGHTGRAPCPADTLLTGCRRNGCSPQTALEGGVSAGTVQERVLTASVPPQQRSFDKTASITFSLSADHHNVSCPHHCWGWGFAKWQVAHLTLLPCPHSPMPTCWRSATRTASSSLTRTRRTRRRARALGSLDGEDGAWQGGQLARAGRLGQAPGVR